MHKNQIPFVFKILFNRLKKLLHCNLAIKVHYLPKNSNESKFLIYPVEVRLCFTKIVFSPLCLLV